MFKEKYDLIITIVNKGLSGAVIEAAQNAGAKGATVLKGHGSGMQNVVMLFEVAIEPEKDIVLCAVPEDISEDVMTCISKNAALEKKGAGISFIVPIKNFVGIFKSNAGNNEMD